MAIIQQYHKDTDTTYVYESESYWVPELGQSRSRRKLLGKLDPVTGEIVPCGKRGPKKKSPETSEEQVSASEYTKLRGKYEQSQTEATKLRLSLTMLLVKMHLRKILPGANQKASQKKHLRIGT